MRERGTVKFFNKDKGFGFIQREGFADTFVHVSDLAASGIESLNEGDPVHFDIVAGKEGKPKAQNISIGLP